MWFYYCTCLIFFVNIKFNIKSKIKVELKYYNKIIKNIITFDKNLMKYIPQVFIDKKNQKLKTWIFSKKLDEYVKRITLNIVPRDETW